MILTRLLAAAAVVGLASPALADTLYSNGLNDGANFTAATPSAPLINGGHATSDSFSLTGAADLTSVTFALITFASERPISAVDWSISSAAGGAGTVFGSGTSNLTDLAAGGAVAGLSNFESSFSVGDVSLAGGTYWLTLQNAVSPTGSVDAFWAESDGPSLADYTPGAGDGVFVALDPANEARDGRCVNPGANGDCSQSFSLNGTPVAVTNPVGGVPEPAAWALMLLGFGGLGAQLRNLRRRAVPI